MSNVKGEHKGNPINTVSSRLEARGNRRPVDAPAQARERNTLKKTPPIEGQRAQRTSFCQENMATFAVFFWIGIVSGALSIICQVAAFGRRDPFILPEMWFGLTCVSIFTAYTACILFLYKLHRAWETVQPLRRLDADLPTPGEAVGFLFFPVWNLYWMFVATVGLIRRANCLLGARSSKPPILGKGIALVYCISAIGLALAFSAGHVINLSGDDVAAVTLQVVFLGCYFIFLPSYYLFARQLTEAINLLRFHKASR